MPSRFRSRRCDCEPARASLHGAAGDAAGLFVSGWVFEDHDAAAIEAVEAEADVHGSLVWFGVEAEADVHGSLA